MTGIEGYVMSRLIPQFLQQKSESIRTVRFTMHYPTPEALLAQLTMSLSQGTLVTESTNDVPLGSEFRFELYTDGYVDPVRVRSVVTSVEIGKGGKSMLHIRYEPPTDRRIIDELLQRTRANAGIGRTTPRVPLKFSVAVDGDGPAPRRLRVLDISESGMGFEWETPHQRIAIGTPFLFQMDMKSGSLLVQGRVRWRSSEREGRFGAELLASGDTITRLRRLTWLRDFAQSPWNARLAFSDSSIELQRTTERFPALVSTSESTQTTQRIHTSELESESVDTDFGPAAANI